jgi:Tol biopolymer transport system component
MNLDGSGQTLLISDINAGANRDGAYDPEISADGLKLSFAGMGTAPYAGEDGFIANIDGSGEMRLETPGLRAFLEPTWSPDGNFVAFSTWWTLSMSRSDDGSPVGVIYSQEANRI